MELRGFDSYPIMLGDEMRGERASLGKSLEDVERDLCIKRRMLVAIENCDLEGFPNRSVVAGYVRSYARYLGMDPEDCYQRFCGESGYQSPVAMMAQQRAGSGATLPLLPVGVVGAEIAHSRFAAPLARSRFMAPVSLGAVTSTVALLALMAGLAYGGYALLQDIQRVGFAPIPQAPAVVAQAPLIAVPQVESGILPLPEASAYQ
ncbi:MAG TPA: helix-turn-helix domain-containing protein, partial [Paracoccaceae bacterium]|nr:helix-turn-helix domain-containing protein [Paracoccaceae bacterium]